MKINKGPKVYGSVWFSLMDGKNIGIVTTNNGFKDKAYIGLGKGDNEIDDIRTILNHGTPFPFKQAIEITGGKNK